MDEGEAKGDGRALIAAEDLACCSKRRQDCGHEESF